MDSFLAKMPTQQPKRKASSTDPVQLLTPKKSKTAGDISGHHMKPRPRSYDNTSIPEISQDAAHGASRTSIVHAKDVKIPKHMGSDNEQNYSALVDDAALLCHPGLKSTNTRYRYKTLENEGVYSIRIMTILPGEKSKPMRVVLKTVPFIPSQGNIPQYEALSYVWGSKENPTKILVADDGTDQFSSLVVTKNLGVVLQYLRNEQEARVLWIDGICIDQSNKDERGHQVQGMADIYRSASRVVAWLGEGTENTAVALKFLEDRGREVEVNWSRYEIRPASGSTYPPVDTEEGIRFQRPEVEAGIYDILCRPWFNRLWIWQEIHLASPTSVLQCGQHQILWTDFSKVMFRLYVQGAFLSHANIKDFEARRIQIYSLCDHYKPPTFEAISSRTKTAKCENPRDRVYAVMSLVPEKGQLDLVPDYTKPVTELYKDVVMADISKTRTLEILRWCEHNPSSLRGLPTWAPDWSNPNCANVLHEKFASATSFPDFVALENGLLQVTGVCVTQIEEVGHHTITSSSRYYSDVLQELKRLFAIYGAAKSGGAVFFDLFFRTMAQDAFSECSEPPRLDYLSLSPTIAALHSLIIEPDIDPDSIATLFKYANGVRLTLPGRSLFTTSNGNFGLGPLHTQAGDQLVVLLGCSSPMVVRSVENGQCQIIGEAYCQDFMAGEALLGSLPDGVERVHFTEVSSDGVSSSVYQRLINSRTRELLEEDPRLENVPLPERWRRSEPGEFIDGNCFVNDETGRSWVASIFDPRMAAVELRKRGVPLEEFVFQ